MNRPRVLLGLRIAFTAVCGLAAVLLVVLWVRSYWLWESVHFGWGTPIQQRLLLSSQSGDVILNYDDFRGQTTTLQRWGLASLPSPDAEFSPIGGMDEAFAGFLFMHGGDGFMLAIPNW